MRACLTSVSPRCEGKHPLETEWRSWGESKQEAGGRERRGEGRGGGRGEGREGGGDREGVDPSAVRTH